MTDSLLINTQIGRYQLVRRIGQGSMGNVYLANDPELNRQVAIKCVSISSDNSLTKRLRSEAQLLAQLNHPNIIQLFDVIEANKTLALVVEYVEGANLAKKCRETEPSRKLHLNWLIQIAEGLQKAHQSGIVHCDLKPENVLVSLGGEVKIADFGIAKARFLTTDNLTEYGHVSGSYTALSPEQAAGKTLDYRTDLFSLGILAHVLLTNNHPFGNNKNQLTTAHNILNRKFSFEPKDKAKLTPGLTSLISKLLVKSPHGRPSSTASVAACFRNELNRELGKDCSSNDLTMEISALKKKSKISISFLMIIFSVSIIMAASAWVFLKSPEVRYVAISTPKITVPPNFDAGQKQRIVSTIEHSLQESLLSIDGLSLIANTHLSEIAGSPKQLAKASGADTVLLSSVNCSFIQCEILLQKLGGSEWQVHAQRLWPTVAESLSDIRNTTLRETSHLFPNYVSAGITAVEVSEADYRSFLKVHKSSSLGSNASDEDLFQLESIQSRAPSFMSIYSLYSKSAIHRYKRSGNNTYLDNLEKFLARAPSEIKNSIKFKVWQFDLHLTSGNKSKASQILNEIKESSSNRVLINVLKGNLAYANNDFKTGLKLDRKTVLLAPSALRYYNLATSEFMAGDINGAKLSIENALSLYPHHTYSHNLKASIALLEGNIDTAVLEYKLIIDKNPESENFSNFGLALALQGNYRQAIDSYLKAIQLGPDLSDVWLNLADTYDLLGDGVNANLSYKTVLEITSQLENVYEYGDRAQALAHLGRHNDAIKTLKTAKNKFTSASELSYAAAIVHALAGNNQASIVEVEEAIKTGTGIIWFNFKWFRSLCDYPRFVELTQQNKDSLCNLAF